LTDSQLDIIRRISLRLLLIKEELDSVLAQPEPRERVDDAAVESGCEFVPWKEWPVCEDCGRKYCYDCGMSE